MIGFLSCFASGGALKSGRIENCFGAFDFFIFRITFFKTTFLKGFLIETFLLGAFFGGIFEIIIPFPRANWKKHTAKMPCARMIAISLPRKPHTEPVAGPHAKAISLVPA